MRRRVVQVWNTPGGVTTALLVVSCAFVSGGIAGLLVASQVAGEGQTTLAAYIESYLAAAQQRTAAAPGFFAVALDLLRWPCLAVFMGFLSLGVVGVPILFAVRGFLLSFAVSSFVRMFGGAGGMLAFSAFGLTGLLAVPALFVLGVQSFDMALRRLSAGAGKGSALPGSQYLVRCGSCFGALALCMLVEHWAVPALLGSLAPLFSGALN